MTDEITYDSEINQPIHKPGMESVVNRSADARDANGNRTGAGRPTVAPGKINPFDIVDGEPPPKAPAKPAPAAAPAVDGSGIGGRDREATIMGQVDKDVTG